MNVRVIAGLIALSGGACGGSDGPGPGPTLPPPPPVVTNAVSVLDSRFSPPAAQVASGTTVTWTWGGALDHNVTFEDGQGSSTTRASGTHQRTFQAGGTIRYRCTIHSTNFQTGMVGTVTVN